MIRIQQTTQDIPKNLRQSARPDRKCIFCCDRYSSLAMSLILSYCLIFCEKSFLRWCIAGNLLLLQKISLRPRESGLAARASPSAVAVDFPEASLSAIPSAYALLMTASKAVFDFMFSHVRLVHSCSSALICLRPCLTLHPPVRSNPCLPV